VIPRRDELRPRNERGSGHRPDHSDSEPHHLRGKPGPARGVEAPRRRFGHSVLRGSCPQGIAHTRERLVERTRGFPARQLAQARRVGHAALHVLESRPVRLGVWDEAHLGAAFGHAPDPLGQLEDRDLLGAADVEEAAGRVRALEEDEQRRDDVFDVAETP